MKRVCVVMANGTEECEALLTVDLLRRAGVEVITASIYEIPEIVSSHDIRLHTDACASQMNGQDFDAIVLPGGMPGTTHLGQSEDVKRICTQAAQAGALLAAICAAPTVLASLGFLENRQATAHKAFVDQLPGALVVHQPVVEDGPIITGWGLGASIPFSLVLVRRLCGEQAAQEVRQAIGYPFAF
ncbi:DJ-1 family glyoxalase III [uncultured Allofournierella sp.]|uniref:DJ-1 family glyoxalase III n=1 Tax=uncultured Allofournierella sp. TaxID=1940258 RepID=UPI003750051E